MKSFLEYINEARSHTDQNPRISYVEELRQYANRKGYYISFRSINKLGINPNNSFNTPIGIYCYPLKEMWDNIRRNHIPFEGDDPAKYVYLLFCKDTTKILNHEITNSKVKQHVEFLIKKYNITEEELNPSDYFVHIGPLDKSPGKSPFQDLWLFTENVAKVLYKRRNSNSSSMKGTNKHTVIWNKLLKDDLGYLGVEDLKGERVIHPNEPIQAVFFSTDALKAIDVFENKRYDNLDPASKQLATIGGINNYEYGIRPFQNRIKSDLERFGTVTFASVSKASEYLDDDECYLEDNSDTVENLIFKNLKFKGSNGNISTLSNILTFTSCEFKGDTQISNARIMNFCDFTGNKFSLDRCVVERLVPETHKGERSITNSIIKGSQFGYGFIVDGLYTKFENNELDGHFRIKVNSKRIEKYKNNRIKSAEIIFKSTNFDVVERFIKNNKIEGSISFTFVINNNLKYYIDTDFMRKHDIEIEDLKDLSREYESNNEHNVSFAQYIENRNAF